MRLLSQSRLLFVVINIPFWVLFAYWGQGMRLATILTAFVAMWSLWGARQKRKHLWTSKLHDIWMCQFFWCFATAIANIELYKRNVEPTVAVLLVDAILCLTIKGVFNDEKYTVNQPGEEVS